MRPILTLQDVLTRLMFFIGVGALAAIVLIYAFEVVSRYAFGAPTLWASDFVSFLLLITVFSTAPWLTLLLAVAAMVMMVVHIIGSLDKERRRR